VSNLAVEMLLRLAKALAALVVGLVNDVSSPLAAACELVIPLGAAMQKSGTAALIAEALQKVVGNWPPLMVLLAIFAIVAIVTQFMSDAATTALFAPVALALAQGLGRAPEPFVVTVAMAAVTAFLTPIGHHGNLLVYGPGRYQFLDFVKVGTPLTVLIALVVTSVALMIWPG